MPPSNRVSQGRKTRRDAINSTLTARDRRHITSNLVVMCLPHSSPGSPPCGGTASKLRSPMVQAHPPYFDRPAHYLRVSILFEN